MNMTNNSTIAAVNQSTLIILASKSLRASSAMRHNQDTHTHTHNYPAVRHTFNYTTTQG